MNVHPNPVKMMASVQTLLMDTRVHVMMDLQVLIHLFKSCLSNFMWFGTSRNILRTHVPYCAGNISVETH